MSILSFANLEEYLKKFQDAVVDPKLFTVVIQSPKCFDVMLKANVTINFDKVDDLDNTGMILAFDDVHVPADVPRTNIKFECSFPYVGLKMLAPPDGFNIIALGVVGGVKTVTTKSFPVQVIRFQWP